MKRLYNFLPLGFFLLLLTACGGGDLSSSNDPEDKAWLETTQKGTEAAYDSFLTIYPAGKYSVQAQDRKEEMLWAYAQTENTVYHYLYYKNMYPSGKYSGEVESKINAITSEEISMAELTERTFAGVIRHNNRDDVEVISLKFRGINQMGNNIEFFADIRASNDVRKKLMGRIEPETFIIQFDEQETDLVYLNLSEGRAYKRNGQLWLESTDPNQYWSMK